MYKLVGKDTPSRTLIYNRTASQPAKITIIWHRVCTGDLEDDDTVHGAL